MAGTTLKAVIKGQARKDGQHLVMVRITHSRAHAHVSLDIYVGKKNWNKGGRLDNKNWVKSGDELQEAYNNKIKRVMQQIRMASERLEEAGRPFTADAVKREFLRVERGQAAVPCFVAFFSGLVERREQMLAAGHGTYSTFKRHRSVLRKLHAYTGGALPVTALTVPFLENYRHHLHTHHGNDHNTVTKDLAVIRTVLKKSIRMELMPGLADPFDNMSLVYRRTRKHTLQAPELQLIKELALDTRHKPHHVRNLYLLQFYCRGARVGDMMQLRRENIDLERDRINYVMEKTGKPVSLKITEGIRWVLRQYMPVKAQGFLLPFLPDGLDMADNTARRKAIESKTANANMDLKEILLKAGINKHITTHSARHTFTSVAARKGVNAAALQGMLQHSSLRETQHYMEEFLDEELDSHAEEVFEGM